MWVAIATLAFAYFFDAVIVNLPFVGGGNNSLLTGTDVPRPVLGPWDLAGRQVFLVLALVVLAIVAVAVIQLRGGHVRQTLLALRGSEVGAESIGISTGTGPAHSPSPCRASSPGSAGRCSPSSRSNVNYGTNFAPFAALFWLVLVVTLGVRTVDGRGHRRRMSFALFDAVVLKGAFLGWMLRDADRIPSFFPISPKWRFVLFGLGSHPVRSPPGGDPRIREAPAGRAQPRAALPLDEPEAAAPTRRRPPRRSWDDRVLRVRGLTKRFAGIVALDGVDIDLEPGERVGLIGPNGAGKTTFFNCMLGVLDADGGTVELDGQDISGLPVSKRARLGIGRTFQRIELFPDSTVRDHLFIAERVRRGGGSLWKDLIGMGRARPDEVARCDEVLELLGLRHLAEEPIERLSLGQCRLVEVGRALMTEPKVLLLDEPSSGLDRAESAALRQDAAGGAGRAGLRDPPRRARRRAGRRRFTTRSLRPRLRSA